MPGGQSFQAIKLAHTKKPYPASLERSEAYNCPQSAHQQGKDTQTGKHSAANGGSNKRHRAIQTQA